MSSRRLDLIRQVSREYVHLQPFVVLDGQLYLASLLEHERNQEQPDLSGIHSLWANSPALANARVAGGLVLVPYPLHLVRELTIDCLTSCVDINDHVIYNTCYESLSEALPFLFSLDPNQVQDFHFYATALTRYESVTAAHTGIAEYQTGIINYDYHFGADSFKSPTFGPRTRTVRVYNSGNSTHGAEEDLCANLAELPRLEFFELCGTGNFNASSHAARLFSSSTLTRLTLDHTRSSHDPHDGFPIRMPALTALTLTFEVAELLFDEEHTDSMFACTAPASILFPTLDRLTLIDGHVWDRDEGFMYFVPWIPYQHMPALTHFQLPLGHHGFEHHHAMPSADLQSLVTHTRLSSFIAPALDDIVTEDAAFSSLPVTASHLTHLDISSDIAVSLTEHITPSNLAFLRLNLFDVCRPIPLFSATPLLVHLDLEVCGFNMQWWRILAEQLPQLVTVRIVDYKGFDSSVSDSQLDSQSDVVNVTPSSSDRAAVQAASIHPQAVASSSAVANDDAHTPALDSVALEATSNNGPHFPHLIYIAFCTHLDSNHGLNDVQLPAIKQLIIKSPHSPCSDLSHVYPHLHSLQIDTAPCPALVDRLLALVPAHCRVRLLPSPTSSAVCKHKCDVDELRMRFAGDANRHVWRALLGATAFGAHGFVEKRICVDVDPEMVDSIRDGDAGLVAKVLAHLLSAADGAGISCLVHCRCGPDALGRQVCEEIVGAIRDQGPKFLTGASVGE